MTKDQTKRNFAKTLGYTCFTMSFVVMLLKGDMDNGMSARYCLMLLVLGFVGLISLTYEPFSGAVRKAAKEASPCPTPSATPDRR